jgi:antitoxin (DNA-binding transcriptional repressor) of toxin-antitoxin stability system
VERVELIDARDRLEELLTRASRGEQFILTEAGKGMALLTAPPPPPPTAEDLDAHAAKVDAAIQELERIRAEYWTPNRGAESEVESSPETVP